MQSEKEIEISLNSESIKDIPFDKYEKNFTFIVNGKHYQINRVVADFLSPHIRQYHFTDETVDRFYIDTEDNDNNFDFNKVLSLISFDKIRINEKDIKYYIKIFLALGNEALTNKMQVVQQEDLTIKNVFNRIKSKEEYFDKITSVRFGVNRNNMSNATNMNSIFEFLRIIENELKFIASHFFEINPEEVKKLPTKYIEEVIKQECLQIESEDSLIDVVNHVYSSKRNEDDDVSDLYDYIYFQNVSDEKLRQFSQIFELRDISEKVWLSIIERSVHSKDGFSNRSLAGRYKSIGKPFQLKKGQDFDGVIKYLTSKTGGNIHDNGTIEVTSNSISGSSYHPKNLLDFNENGCYCANGTDAWICFDFKNRKLKLTNYSIKSYKSNPNGHHLRSWKIEVSNDGENWTKIDDHKDCPTLNGPRITGTFEVQPNEFSRYIRFYQTGVPWTSNNLWFYYIEFYGFLQEK